MTGKFYDADPDDPEAPVLLGEWSGLKPGDHVRLKPSCAPLPGPLVIAELWDFGEGFVQAVLNDGEYEVTASNLVLDA